MDELERQLERLRTLRDSGALTEAEYELEAARLTPPAPPIAAQPSIEPPPPPPAANVGARKFNPRLVIAPLAAIAIAVAIYFLVAGRGQQSTAVADATPVKAAAPAPAAAAGSPTMRDRPEAEQLDAAFRAVFGRASPVEQSIEETPASERAVRVVWASFGPILLTERSIADGAHVAVGYVGAYYLRDTGTGFEVAQRYPEAAPGWGWGSPPNDWRIADNFTTHPAIYAEGGTLYQGYATAAALLVELRPEGPSLSSFELGADNSGAAGDEGDAQTYEGEIRNVVRDQSLDVVFTGTCEFTRRYLFRNNKFEPETELVPECAG